MYEERTQYYDTKIHEEYLKMIHPFPAMSFLAVRIETIAIVTNTTKGKIFGVTDWKCKIWIFKGFSKKF